MTHQLLQHKRGVIFGVLDRDSLAWAVARQCKDEGAALVLTNTETSLRLGPVLELAAEVEAPFIPADATNIDDLRRLWQEAQQHLGEPIDFVLHAVAQSDNIRRHRAYEEASHNYMMHTLDVSALSLHKLLQTAMEADALSEGASVVTLTYIASEQAMANYSDMGDAKALLESIARNFGRAYGERKGVRINCVSQSPTPTRAARQCESMDRFRHYVNALAPLGNADAESCAKVCTMLFSDYTPHVTMQTIYNDGGFAHTGLTDRVVKENAFGI